MSTALAVAALVKTFLVNNSEPKKLAPLLAPDAIVVVDGTIARSATGDDAATYMMWFTTKSVAQVTVHEHGHVAWFQTSSDGASFDQSGDACHYNKHCDPLPLHFHVSGAAIDDHGWKLAVVILTRTIGDRELVDTAKTSHDEAAPKTLATSGDHDLAAAGEAWLAGKLAKSAEPNALATGTSPSEIAQDAAALKLAGKWDKLALAGVTLEATVLPSGVGLVYADVRWPYKPTVPVQMRLAAVAVREGDAWKWAVVDFAR